MATKIDILEADRWFTNSDFAVNCLVKQSDTTTAQDITGWTLSWLLKRRSSDADANAILTKTSAAGISIIDPVLGHCRIVIADDDTNGTVKSGVYEHELKRTDAGFDTVIIKGTAILRASAHRS